MKLKELGKNSSVVEVTQISPYGIWLLARGEEYFLPYKRFFWFEDATVSEIHNVRLLHGFHLRWPDLDIDLHLDSLKDPDKYPLVYKRNLAH